MTAQENPFVFGEIIDDANFVDRDDELNGLVRDLADGQKVFLLSPRRFGKSSLVAVALREMGRDCLMLCSCSASSSVVGMKALLLTVTFVPLGFLAETLSAFAAS